MKTVVFNPVAVDDLEEIVEYISQDNGVAAEAVRCDILGTSESLADQPGLGIRPRFSAPRFAGIRYLPCEQYPNYLLFYRELGEEIEVLRIIHGARNLPALFE
jgi:toxin ParE1/3/4